MEREEAVSELCVSITYGVSSTTYYAPLKAPVKIASILITQHWF